MTAAIVTMTAINNQGAARATLCGACMEILPGCVSFTNPILSRPQEAGQKPPRRRDEAEYPR